MAEESKQLGSFVVSEDARGFWLTIHKAWYIGPFPERDDALRWALAWLVRIDENMRVDTRAREEQQTKLEAVRKALLAQVLEPVGKKTN